MAGRGGRGAAMRAFLEAQAQKKLEEEQQAGIGLASSGAPQTAPPLQMCPSQGVSTESAPPKPKGRGQMLKQYKEQKEASQVSQVGHPTPVTLPERTQVEEVPSTSLEKKLSASPKSLAKDFAKLSMNTEPVHYRGTDFNARPVMVNYINIDVSGDKGMYEYEVKFDPPIDSLAIRRRLVRDQANLLGRYRNFDGHILYLPYKQQSDVVHATGQTHEGKEVRLSFIYKRQRFFHENVHFYNILFRTIAEKLSMVKFRDAFFDPNAKTSMPQYKLEIWPGFVTAVDEYEGGLKLQIDTSSRVLRTQTCLELIEELRERDPAGYKSKVTEALVGQVVLTRYNNSTYRVDDVDYSQSPMSTFLKRGTPITFKEYYSEVYDQNIKYKDQPLLISKVKRRQIDIPGQKNADTHTMVAIVPELAYLTGLSDALRSDFHAMKNIGSVTRVSPNQKLQCIQKYIDNVNKNKECSELLAGWGLNLDKSLHRLDARCAPMEKIILGGAECNANMEADWNRDLARNKPLDVINFHKWVVIHIKRDGRNANNFVSCMQKLSGPLGIRIAQPNVVALNDEQVSSYLLALEALERDVQFVVIIFNQPRTDRYAAVKKMCCCDRPIPSQVINSRTISKEDKMKSIVMKIALQINCKLGGSLWTVKIPYIYSMAVGIDVYHEGAGGKGQNFVGLVATMNKDYSKYYSQTVRQERGQEITHCILTPFEKAVKRYIAINNVPPKMIFIYRDGVSDGQLDHVKRVEYEQYKMVIAGIMGDFPNLDYQTKITMVIVQKRINTKIFGILGSGDTPKLDNPLPGTIVDYSCTRKTLKDFFLISQHVRQGTVTPTHYIVLVDESNIKVEYVQRLSYKMCHLYYNWPGTIRVPAVCQYAHRIAQLAGMHLKRIPSESLSNSLFYL